MDEAAVDVVSKRKVGKLRRKAGHPPLYRRTKSVCNAMAENGFLRGGKGILAGGVMGRSPEAFQRKRRTKRIEVQSIDSTGEKG